MSYVEDYGIKNIVIGSLMRHAKQRQFKTERDLLIEVQWCIELLEAAKDDLIAAHNAAHNCTHDAYKKATYTSRRMASGDYKREYERKCRNCGFIDQYGTFDEKDPKAPDWTIGASEQYYNNDI